MSASPNRRHLIIPDAQLKPGVPTDHIGWAAEAIVEYRPDVVVVMGDWWDMPSLSTHSKALEKEGARVYEDVQIGNDMFSALVAPMEAERARLARGKRKAWNPELHYLFGNHEYRIERAVAENPHLAELLSLAQLRTPGFTRHPFLEIVYVDGIAYSHYFANTHSGRPIGGSIDNRLNKIGTSFVAGHEQGFLYGVRQYPGQLTRHGLVAGSFYLHDEHYRGAQGTGEWRGIVVLNEVRDGTYDIMPLSMNYLRGKYGNT